MACLNPAEFVTKMVDSGESKLPMSTRDTLIQRRRAPSWRWLPPLLSPSPSSTGNPSSGPCCSRWVSSFVPQWGFETAHRRVHPGPLAVMDKPLGATWAAMRNWGLVFCGNFAGALTVAVFMAIIPAPWSPARPRCRGRKTGPHRRRPYSWAIPHTALRACSRLFIRVMCNWMVSTSVVAASDVHHGSGSAICGRMPVMVFS